MDRKADILIIGSGAAGSSAAFAARKKDPDCSILVLSKEEWPEYSAPALPDFLSGELTRDKILVRTKQEYEEAGIELLGGVSAESIAPDENCVYLEDGDAIAFETLILASGSQPIRLRRMAGTDLPGNFVMKSMGDVDDMLAYGGRSAVVVGSGAIGLEGSMALKKRGFERVTMVEALDWLSPKSLDKETSDELQAVLEGFGVEVLTGEAVEGVLGTEKVEGVKTSKREIPCDLILWGIGMRPDVALAADAGIELGQLGAIRVDDHMRSSVPYIYACGDCVESLDQLSGDPAVHLFWEPAQRGGTVAGTNAAGGELLYQGSCAVFLTNKGGLSIVALGKTAAELDADKAVILQEKRDGVFRRLLLEDGRLKGAQMVGSLEDVDLFFENIRKNAMPRTDVWDLVQPVPDPENKPIDEVIDFLRKERRGAVK